MNASKILDSEVFILKEKRILYVGIALCVKILLSAKKNNVVTISLCNDNSVH